MPSFKTAYPIKGFTTEPGVKSPEVTLFKKGVLLSCKDSATIFFSSEVLALFIKLLLYSGKDTIAKISPLFTSKITPAPEVKPLELTDSLIEKYNFSCKTESTVKVKSAPGMGLIIKFSDSIEDLTPFSTILFPLTPVNKSS